MDVPADTTQAGRESVHSDQVGGHLSTLEHHQIMVAAILLIVELAD